MSVMFGGFPAMSFHFDAALEQQHQQTQALPYNKVCQTIDGIKRIQSALDPQSPASIALQSRLASLEAVKSTQDFNLRLNNYLPSNDPLSQQIKHFAGMLPNLQPNSAPSNAIKQHILQLGHLRPELVPVTNRIVVDSMVQTLNRVGGALATIQANLDSESPVFKALNAKRQSIGALQQSLIQYENQPFPTVQGAEAISQQFGQQYFSPGR
jgi:hypothetical protein